MRGTKMYSLVIPRTYALHNVARRVLYVRPVSGGSVGCSERDLEPDFRKEDGGSGREPRAGRQPDSRQANPCNGETPEASCGGFIAVKAMGGAGVKAPARCAEGKPGGGEAQEGRGSIGV